MLTTSEHRPRCDWIVTVLAGKTKFLAAGLRTNARRCRSLVLFIFGLGPPGSVRAAAAAGKALKGWESMFEKWKGLSRTEKVISIAAPVSGTVVPLAEVNDPTFAQGILGRGVAIQPAEGRVYAPADGTVDLMFETGHALSMTTDDGAEVLIHGGLDTVRLCGRHYRVLCQSGDRVACGQPLIEFEPEAIRAAGFDPVTPVLVCNTEAFTAIDTGRTGAVTAGEVLLTLHQQQ